MLVIVWDSGKLLIISIKVGVIIIKLDNPVMRGVLVVWVAGPHVSVHLSTPEIIPRHLAHKSPSGSMATNVPLY